MTVVNKPLGDPLRREIRQDLRAHFNDALQQAIGNAKVQAREAAKAELAAMPDPRTLGDAEYRKLKRRAITLTGRLDNPRP
jgi:hypothetical protein